MSQRVRAGWVGAALAAAVAFGGGAACTSDAPQGEPEAVDGGPPARDGSAPAPAEGKAGIKVSPPTSASTSESGGTASFTVVLSSRPKGTVVVTIASTKPAEGVTDTSALTFTAESWATPQTVTVTGVDDPITDGDQPYAIAVGPVQSSDARYAALDPDDVALTNSDDDVAGLLVSAPSPSPTVNEAGASATFTVHLRAKPVGDVRVPLVVSKPLEAKIEPQELVFTAADYATPKAVVVTGKDDAVADGDQPFTVSLGPAVSAHAAYAGVTSPALAFTNQDDDIAGFLVGSAMPTTHTSEAGGAVTVTVRLRSMPAADVTIPVSTSKPSEGAASVASLAFTPADYATPQTITVTGVGDFVDDGDQSYALVLGAASSADAKYQGLDAPDVALTNDDDDTAGVTVSAPTPGSTTSEAGGQVSFTVVLKSQPTSDVTIPVASSNTAEGTVDKASLTFTPADWDTPQTVTVSGADDATLDADQAYSIVLGAASSVDALYNGLNPTDVALTNINNCGNGVVNAGETCDDTRPGCTSCQACRSLSFNGADASVLAPALSLSDSAFTMEAWVYVPAYADNSGSILSIGYGTGSYKELSMAYYWCGPGCPQLGYFAVQTPGKWHTRTNVKVPTGRWSHLAVVHVTGATYRFYVDGVEAAVAYTDGNAAYPIDGPVALGMGSNLGDGVTKRPFNGSIDSARVSVGTRYSANFVPPKRLTSDGATIAAWALDEGTGLSTADGSGNGRTGTISNATWQATCPP